MISQCYGYVWRVAWPWTKADFECARPQRMVDWKRTKFRVQVENACQVAIGDRFRQAIDQVCWIEGAMMYNGNDVVSSCCHGPTDH